MALNEDQQTEAVFKSMRGEVDPVSGNEVPPGSLPEEVRDDVPAMLSEGEYVVPADVLRFYGVKFFEDLRAEAKMGLAEMESNGRIGGEPVMEDDELPFSDEELMVEDIPDDAVEMNRGGVVGFAPGGLNIPGYIKQPDLSFLGGTYDTGTSTGGVEYRTFVNDAGMTITIPFFNGEPMGMIPPGYKPGDATTKSEEDGTGGVTDRGEDDRGGEGRSINDEQDRDTTPIGQMDATQVADAYSGLLSNEAKATISFVGALTGASLPTGLIGLANKMSQKSIEARAEKLGIDLSTVTKGEDLNRSNFVSDEAFNDAMASVAPTGMSYDPDTGSYGRDGPGDMDPATAASTPSAHATARAGMQRGVDIRSGTGSTSSTSSSSGKGFMGSVSEALGNIAEALGFSNDNDNDNDNGNDSGTSGGDASPANDGLGNR